MAKLKIGEHYLPGKYVGIHGNTHAFITNQGSPETGYAANFISIYNWEQIDYLITENVCRKPIKKTDHPVTEKLKGSFHYEWTPNGDFIFTNTDYKKNKTSNRYICGVDYGDGKSPGTFTVFKDGKLKWHTQKLWKAKLYLWCMKVKGATIIRETA